MAYEKNFWTWARKAAEALNDLTAGTGHLNKAISAVTGKIASTGQTAVGLLKYGADNTGHVNMGYNGIQKFVAGAAISSADVLLTVTTSGYFIEASSGDYIIGKSLINVASGAVGTGMFSFANPVPFNSNSGYNADFNFGNFTAQSDLSAAAGLAVSITSGTVVDCSQLVDGICITGTASGSTSVAAFMGKMTGRAGDTLVANQSLKVVAGGYFESASSGDLLVGRPFAAAASGASFDGVFNFATPHYATSCFDVMFSA
jgi:hypothetical protein